MGDVKDFKVLTFNAWGLLYLTKDLETRIIALSEELAKGEYDLVHLQEIWSSRHYEMIREKVKHVLPYSYYFHSGFMGAGCTTLSRYPIVDTFFHKYSHNGHFYDYYGDWYAGKGVGCAIIRHPKRKIYSFNSHLHADYMNNNNAGVYETRVLQCYELAQFVRHTTRPGDAVIVSGDINHTPDELGTITILELTKLNDTYQISASKPSECNTINIEFNKYAGPPDITSRIDYIFTSDNFECKSCSLSLQKIPNTDLHFSDHEGYTATLQFKESDVNECTEYNEDSTSRDLLCSLQNVMRTGEQISNEIHWKTFLSLCVMFVMLVLMPIFSLDTFHVLFPAITTWCGKGVFILQITCTLAFALYVWVIAYFRVLDCKIFRTVSLEIDVKLCALEGIGNKKEK